jgi:hypothetical protein
MLPQANPASIGGETSGVHVNCVMRVCYTRYAVPLLVAAIAAGRTEDNILFWKNVALRATFFQKDWKRTVFFTKNLL